MSDPIKERDKKIRVLYNILITGLDGIKKCPACKDCSDWADKAMAVAKKVVHGETKRD